MKNKHGYFHFMSDFRDAFNKLLALFFLIPALPILGLLFMAMRLSNRDGGPFFYRGQRLGKDKKPFTMYKVRTLAGDAETVIGEDLLDPSRNFELPGGRFLRETRLDELPQLFNVLKGDMNMVGPRPVRPLVYEKCCRQIRNYDNRFDVKPGITGYAQFFTAHRAPKKIRSVIDNHFVRVRANLLWDMFFVLWSGFQVVRKTAIESWRTARDSFRAVKSTGSPANRRKMRRVRGEHIDAVITDDSFDLASGAKCVVADINYSAVCLLTDADLDPDNAVSLVLSTDKRAGAQRKLARCKGAIHRKSESGKQGLPRFRYVVFYEPVSDLNRYIVDQYMLRTTVA